MILTSLMLTPLVGALDLGVVPRSNERLAKIVAATYSLAPLAGSNGVGDLAKELAYAQANGQSGLSLALGTEPFSPGL